jgi:hypothetical protein
MPRSSLNRRVELMLVLLVVPGGLVQQVLLGRVEASKRDLKGDTNHFFSASNPRQQYAFDRRQHAIIAPFKKIFLG